MQHKLTVFAALTFLISSTVGAVDIPEATCLLACPPGQILNAKICQCIEDPRPIDHTAATTDVPENTCYLACPPGQVLDRKNCQCIGNAIPEYPKPIDHIPPITDSVNQKVECPLFKCAVTNALPCYQYKKDAKGCPTCKCQCFGARARVCPLFCPYNVERTVDIDGCNICRCKPRPPTCSQIQCRLFCRHGFIKDQYGCDICACKPRCGPVCKIFCPYGNVLDKLGCKTCTCKPRPSPIQCGPVCAIYCKYGNKLDARGCPTCTCNKGPQELV